ncbi:response regulator [Myxosarcina sp. GI1(2024)]
MAIKRILVIDDNDDSRDLVKTAFELNTNWEILTASNGIEGIAKAELERPDVILLDLVMPEVDGLAVYERLQNNLFTCTIPVIFITAMVNKNTLTKLNDTYALKTITKPFYLDDLTSKIVEIFDWQLHDLVLTS